MTLASAKPSGRSAYCRTSSAIRGKSSSPQSEAFCADARRVAEGGSALDPEVVGSMLARGRRDPVDQLTPRQRDVLALMAEGRSNAAIAQQLTLTDKAVVKHVSHIYDALGLEPSPEDHRRVLAVVRYLTG